MVSLVPWLLVACVLPVWVAAGLADWACHRATRIEVTGGVRENAMHWLMFAQAGVGMAAALFFAPSGAVLLVVLASFLLHETTVLIELRYVAPRRAVRPVEQMVHSFMEILPLVVMGLVAADAGAHGSLRSMALVPAPDRLPLAAWLGAAGAIVLFNALPLMEETRRCRSALTPTLSRAREREPGKTTADIPPPPAPR